MNRFNQQSFLEGGILYFQDYKKTQRVKTFETLNTLLM